MNIPSPHPALAELPASDRDIALETMALLCDQPYVFAIVTGTHQYGFVSDDGDIDVRGAFTAPTESILGFETVDEHKTIMTVLSEREVDGVAFEMRRFIELILKGAGNLVEELYSPHVLFDSGHLDELREAVRPCLTSRLFRHYIGFFRACVKKLKSEKKPPEVKTALYATRIALSGITLLREGIVEAHLPTLNQQFNLPFVEEWRA
ncbi:MAG: nucleotidyltransferase domain-containing protein, partial [Myxococcales bacterium]|nr:nucleotidyltransferase domain-containing protein [Myxococcales bacterium]